MRVGAWFDGRYLQSKDFPGGILGWEAAVSHGLRDGSTAWRLGGSRRVGALGARGHVGLRAVDDEGLLRTEAAAGNWITGPGRRRPWHTWELGIQYRDRDDLAPVDARYWSAGRTINGSASLRFEGVGPRHQEQARLAFVHGAPVSTSGAASSTAGGYTSARFEARQSLDVIAAGAVRVTWRIAAGAASRNAPREQLLDVAEGSRLDALARFYENDRGPLRETDHYLSEGGGGLRGFAGRAVLGRRLVALNLEAGHAAVPLAVFGGVGRVEEPGQAAPAPGSALAQDLTGRTLADFGVAYSLGRIRLVAPLWVSRPEPDERPWDVRWLVSLDLAGLHSWW